MDTTSRIVVLRAILDARDPTERRRLVRTFLGSELPFLLRQLEGDDGWTPESVASALRLLAGAIEGTNTLPDNGPGKTEGAPHSR